MNEPGTSELHTVLLQGKDPHVDLAAMIRDLSDKRIRTPEEAAAVCDILRSIPAEKESIDIDSRLGAITSLLHYVATESALEMLRDEATPELCRIFDEMWATEDTHVQSDLLDMLLWIVRYDAAAGTERVIQAVRRPMAPNTGFGWMFLFGAYDADHPHTAELMEQLADPLPTDELAYKLLGLANRVVMKDENISHPFDSPQGIAKLRTWLMDHYTDDIRYAHTAAVALAFISEPARDELLALAMDHPEIDVQMEAAWAAAKIGDEVGVRKLAEWCLDPHLSFRVRHYLEEVDRADEIPAKAKEPNFAAMAEMSHWLSHPMEFGRQPTELALYDTRELYWPPTDDRRQVWLFKFLFAPREEGDEEEVGVGMVGSRTFALSPTKTADLTPLDVYALHCDYELRWKRDPRASEKPSVSSGRDLLQKHNPELTKQPD